MAEEEEATAAAAFKEAGTKAEATRATEAVTTATEGATRASEATRTIEVTKATGATKTEATRATGATTASATIAATKVTAETGATKEVRTRKAAIKVALTATKSGRAITMIEAEVRAIRNAVAFKEAEVDEHAIREISASLVLLSFLSRSFEGISIFSIDNCYFYP